MPSPVIEAGNTAVSKGDEDFCPRGVYVLVDSDREQTKPNKQNTQSDRDKVCSEQ